MIIFPPFKCMVNIKEIYLNVLYLYITIFYLKVGISTWSQIWRVPNEISLRPALISVSSLGGVTVCFVCEAAEQNMKRVR